MKCSDIHKRIILFSEGALNQTETNIIKGHLAGCPECAGFLKELELSLQVIEHEKQTEVNPFIFTRIQAGIEDLEGAKPIVSQRPFLVRILQPALYSLLLIIGIYTGTQIGIPAKPASDNTGMTENEMVPFFDEMEAESIENFLLE